MRDSETTERSLINNFDPRGGNGHVICRLRGRNRTASTELNYEEESSGEGENK